MDEKHKGILMFAAAVLSIGLLFGTPSAKAADGDLNVAGIVLKDTNANGKIDEVQITVDYAAGTANAISHAANLAATISKFTVTDTTTGNPVAVSSIDFVSGNGTVAVFKLVLSEADADLSVNTSATALNVVYDATGSDLKITNGITPVNVAAIASSVVEKDGAAPVAMSAAYKDINLDGTVDRVDVTYSETIAGSVFTASEWSLPTNPHSLVISSGTFSGTDVLIIVTGAPVGNTALSDTAIKYTAGTGITDGVNPAATSAVLPVGDKARPIILAAVDQSVTPLNLDGGTNIPANANIIISFSEPMDTTSLDAASEWTISPDPVFWALPVWSNSNKTVTLSHTSTFTAGSVETVTLSAPLAVSGVLAADKALQNAPIAAAVNNPFTFTVAGTIVPTPTPTPTPIPTPAVSLVSPYWSTISASPVVLIADGTQTSSIAVIVKNSLSGPLADKDVIVSSSRGASDTITAIIGKSNANGIATFEIKSSTAGKAIITAKVGDITIAKTVTVNFLPVGSQIGNPTTPNENSGVILYRIPGSPRVYVIKNHKKHWIKNEQEFEHDGYSWKNIQDISAAILAKYPDAEQAIAELIRAIGDSKVYRVKDGKKEWIKSAEEFNAAGYDWNNIQNVTPDTLATYTDAQLADALVKIVNAMNLRVRSADSSQSAVLDTVKNSEVYQIVEKKNGWYKIKTKHGKEGWISGKYAKEKDKDENDND